MRNARVAGEVTLTRGHRSETVSVVELGPGERAPILREYLRRVPIVRPFFDATASSPLASFVAEAARHPVFRLVRPPVGDRRDGETARAS